MGPFAMPMFRDFVPKQIRPWIYVCFAFCFLLTGGIYGGTTSHVMGQYSLIREDVTMITMCNVVGVAMPFPFLFKMKFAFTNHRLLLNAALMIALCQTLMMFTQWLPLMCVLAFISGFFKLCGCFECMSNVQLWMTPKREFTIFFPLLYCMVLGNQFLNAWISAQLTYITQDWRAMHMLIVGLMLIIIIVLKLCTRNWHFMKHPMPFISVDYLGLLLWSSLLLEVVFFFTYGEHYNWFDGRPIRQCALLFVVTAYFCLQRMRHIRHAYIDRDAWRYPRLIPLLILFGFEVLMGSSKTVLQPVLTGKVLHWGWITTSSFHIVEWLSAVAGCLFVMLWIKGWHQKYTRLLTVAAITISAYPVMMYFLIDTDTTREMFYVPIAFYGFGNAIFFTTLTIYLQELMPFHHFFMGLTMAGMVRNGPIGAMWSGLYSFGLRYLNADNLSRGLPYDATGLTMLSLRQLFGLTCIVGCAVALIFLLWDVQPVRTAFKRMPLWSVVARTMRIKENNITHNT